ncbi:hypothetical protein ACKWTF_014161 [Chironomus riparius]
MKFPKSKAQLLLITIMMIHRSSQNRNYSKILCKSHSLQSDSISTKSYCSVDSTLIIHQENTAIFISNSNSHQFEAFLADKSEIFYFPHNIEESMSKIKEIKIVNSKMRKITQNDLKSLINLEYLDLNGNDIKVLPENLFQFNTNLRKISFNNNKIFFVFPTAFDNINNLITFGFFNNKCYSDDGSASTLAQSNIKTIKLHCYNHSIDKMIQYVEHIEESLQTQFDNIRTNPQTELNNLQASYISDFPWLIGDFKASHLAVLTAVNSIFIIILSITVVIVMMSRKSPRNQVCRVMNYSGGT